MTKLAERIAALRKRKNLSQTEFAKRLGVGRSTVAMWETADREPDAATIQRIADFFNVSTDYLLGRTDDPTPPGGKKPVIDPDLAHDISDLTPEELELLNRLKKEVAFKNYLEAPEEAKKEFIKAVKLLMQGMKDSKR
ncbi:MAG: helix-turn-helix domain-containing protein [Firmicutes bacterium]|nr:helix-turn-helix domain-containing protein [Bacillota bacterium]